MSLHRFIIDVLIDDEMLAEHDGDEMSPPNDITEWEANDIESADHRSLIDSQEIVEYVGEVDESTGMLK